MTSSFGLSQVESSQPVEVSGFGEFASFGSDDVREVEFEVCESAFAFSSFGGLDGQVFAVELCVADFTASALACEARVSIILHEAEVNVSRLLGSGRTSAIRRVTISCNRSLYNERRILYLYLLMMTPYPTFART